MGRLYPWWSGNVPDPEFSVGMVTHPPGSQLCWCSFVPLWTTTGLQGFAQDFDPLRRLYWWKALFMAWTTLWQSSCFDDWLKANWFALRALLCELVLKLRTSDSYNSLAGHCLPNYWLFLCQNVESSVVFWTANEPHWICALLWQRRSTCCGRSFLGHQQI